MMIQSESTAFQRSLESVHARVSSGSSIYETASGVQSWMPAETVVEETTATTTATERKELASAAEPQPKARPSSSSGDQWTHSRPVHTQKFTSLLSKFGRQRAVPNCHCNIGRGPGLSGFKHLLMMVVFLCTLRLVWRDVRRLGPRAALAKAGFHSEDLKYCLYIMVANVFYLPVALHIEKCAYLLLVDKTARTKGEGEGESSDRPKPPPQPKLHWKFVAALHVINATVCLVMSSWLCYVRIWNPLIATLCEANTIITFLKLTSYCLAVRDLRAAYLSGEKSHEFYCNNTYPHNLTLGNLVYFWFAPTLIYQPVYPRTEKVRWQIVLALVGEVVTGLFFMWMLAVDLAAPILRSALEHYRARESSLVDDFLQLCAVNIVIWLLGFLVIFQSLLNLLAELTRFADRDFYRDWWNAGCLGTYWRDWNKPISNYLRRHIYVPLRKRGWNQILASTVVFLVSAVFHELLVGVATQNFNGVAFSCMLAQIPLIKITAPLERIRGRGTTVGNCIFWLSILLGQPAGMIIYYVAWNLRYGQNR